MTISIITPWLNGLDLIPGYTAAVQGAQVITIDNGSMPDVSDALAQMSANLGNGSRYIRNETNAGFSAANNQGYALATGDIIIFLNSDVQPAGLWLEAVAAQVRDGALYGPSVAQQLVYGRWLPYIEGWCVAATKQTWERLCARTRHGDLFVSPWDAEAYPGPYWEDNDLSLRALQAGVDLIQTFWPVQHLGGRTAGSIARHAKSYEANRATFAARVADAVPETLPSGAVWERYLKECATPSDIQHHLPLLFSLARGNVLELGTRTGVSTAALLAGVERHGGAVWSVDIDDCSKLFEGHLQWAFEQGSTLDPHTIDAVGIQDGVEVDFDLMLIDTLHHYDHVKREFELWAPRVKPGGCICVHDTETFPGVRAAVAEYCAAKGWPVTWVLPCNGMAVVEVQP